MVTECLLGLFGSDGEAGMTLAEGLTPQILSDLGIDPGHV